MASGCARSSSGWCGSNRPAPTRRPSIAAAPRVEELLRVGGRRRPPVAAGRARRSPPRRVRAAADRRCCCSATSTPCGRSGQLERMPLRRDDGRLHGPGVFDMKAGIGVALLAVRALQRDRPPRCRRIVMLWTTDEEIGSETSRAAIEEEARRARAVLVLEPSLPGGGAKTSAQGLRRVRADGARRRRRTPGSIPARARARSTSWPRQIVADRAAAGSAARHQRQRRRRRRAASRPNVVAEDASRDDRRPGPDAGGRPTRSRRPCAGCSPQIAGHASD